jgi:hypothetical protein
MHVAPVKFEGAPAVPANFRKLARCSPPFARGVKVHASAGRDSREALMELRSARAKISSIDY